MHRVNFTDYDDKPEGMIVYLRNYGPHFNKKLSEFAASKMERDNHEPIKPYQKSEIDTILQQNKVTLKYNQLYDYIYVANMCQADFLGSSIMDAKHLTLYIKDVIDDPDAVDGLVFNRWYADMCYKGIAIDWDDMI